MAGQNDAATTRSKFIVLVVMALLTTVYLVLIRWTRTKATEKYITTTAVVVQECLKLIFAFGILVVENRGLLNALKTLKMEAIDLPVNTLKMSVPSLVYALQNNMNFIALSNLEVPVQQILYQLKIPAAALCSVLILGKSLSYQQWSACFMVFIGLAIIEYNPDATSPQAKEGDQNYMIGVGAVMVAVFCSAFAGVYFEKIVKKDKASLWVCNIQMYVWTTLASIIGVMTTDYSQVREKGFFYGYTSIVWFLLFIGAVNGLIVSLVLKYADNIVKGFAAAFSIVLSTIVSFFLFDYIIGVSFLIGGAAVCGAICLYGIPLPCLDTKYTTVAKKMSGPNYEQLRSATSGNDDNDEVVNKP